MPTETLTPPAAEPMADVALAKRIQEGREKILSEVRKIIVGQEEAVEHVLLTLLVGGNSLLVGVPGLAKTLLIHSIAQVLDLKFSRIQFTPDLMPSDITGTDIIQQHEDGTRGLEFTPGPIFANVVLADEINRTPPKTQAALLEAMQEHRVTVQANTYILDPPFYVFATQNPNRAGGDLPAPRGAAGPLHVPHRHGSPGGGRGDAGRAGDDRRGGAGTRRRRVSRGHDRVSGPGAARAGRRARDALRRQPGARQPAEPERQPRLRKEVDQLRGQRPRRPVPHPRR